MSEIKLAAALAAFQQELPRIGKDNTAQVKSDKGNYSYRYADLATISQAVLPVAAKHGLSFSARPTVDEHGRFVLAYELLHASGETRAGSYPLPAANAKPQEIGSAITYARRYALCALLGIAPDEDDDGASAPAASSRPVERHDSTWDAAEQEMLRDAYEAEIAKAADRDAVLKIGAAVRRQKQGGDISPSTYERLSKAAGARLAQLEATKGAGSE